MHPHALLALTALASLESALMELRFAAIESTEDGIPSQTYGTRYALGGHSDPVADQATAAAHAAARGNPHGLLLTEVSGILDRLARSLSADSSITGDPVERIRHQALTLPVSMTRRLADGLANLDRIIRRHLRIGPALAPAPGNPPCPACELQMLLLTLAQTIICGADCTCVGPECPCGMPAREAGLPHIWPAEAPDPIGVSA